MFFKRTGEGKKEIELFKSRHLLHTIYKFATSEWNGKEIAKNKFETLKKFEEDYEKFKKEYGKE